MFTDVRNSSTELLMAGKALNPWWRRPLTHRDGRDGGPAGVISRKKQMVPVLINRHQAGAGLNTRKKQERLGAVGP